MEVLEFTKLSTEKKKMLNKYQRRGFGKIILKKCLKKAFNKGS